MMATGDNLAQALGNLDIIDQLPEHDDGKATRWREKCAEQEKLTSNYKGFRIGREFLRFSAPRCFSISQEVREKVFQAKVEEIEGVSNLLTCTRHQYATCLKRLLEAEEMHQSVEMRKHDLASQKLWIERQGYRVSKFGFRMANLANKSPSIVSKDFVILETQHGLQLAIPIDNATNDYIYLLKVAGKRHFHSLLEPVKVSFLSAGVPFRMQQTAIEDLQGSSTMQSLVFEEVGDPENEVKIQTICGADFEELDERLDKLNECQRAAVLGILEAKCRPKPYILFGPPGTGKTHTLVEAVVQVYKRSRSSSHESNSSTLELTPLMKLLQEERERRLRFGGYSRNTSGEHNERFKILVCINSNNCVDELHQKIKQELPSADVTRLSAGSFPNRDDRSEIVVTTNIKSGAYREIQWKFDYVFVDEAGHANMAESLVPASVLKEDGCLVLAGDPHQLGPVVTCDGAAKMGLEESLLERLFKFNLYQKDPVTREYDGRHITMLQDCYRCDPRILTTCNRLFYDNKLRCINSTPRGLLKILNLTGPLQLQLVSGEQTRMAGSDSWYNQAEIDVCIDLVKRLYLMGIEPKQIGVTSPYKLQAYKIRQALKGSTGEDQEVSALKERFGRTEYKPIAAEAPFWDGLTPEAIKKLSLPTGSTLCRKMDDESHVACTIDTLPADLGDLYVRRVVKETKWDCKVDSIDAFQGGEKEIMIISTVRTGGNTRFISDKRRFNVAISRAKWLVIVVGDAPTLKQAEYWDELLRETVGEVDSWPKSVDCSQPFLQLQPIFGSR